MLIDQFDVFLLDLDGVVYVGDQLLPGVSEAFTGLQNRGKVIRFVTNDPRPTRMEIVDRLGRLGVMASVEQIVSSGWATARWLRQHGITSAYVVGSDGLRAELAANGVSAVAGSGAEAVVVGCDETVTYRDIAQASVLVRAGVAFVATNVDATFPTGDELWPATGAVVSAVQTASGRRPVVVGKPSPEMFRLARQGLAPTSRVVVVGDTVATDIAGAHRAGLPAVLVATTAPGDPGRCDRRMPEATVGGLAGLFDPDITIEAAHPASLPWPDEVRAGVAAVVFDEAGRVLLGRRLDNGLWGLPSGHVEVGETAAQAAVREVAEETGLLVRVQRLIGVYSDPASQVFAYPDGRVTQFVTTTFACVPCGGQLAPDGTETSQAGFFSPHDLPKPLLTMHPRWLADALSGGTGFVD
ncbi:MAG: HAD-IIA family hydrolase [Propionibacteriaceae bacterium]|nr:HAD-IIA family hydrolase [Propionibacteriaceae bacterium]